MKKNIVFLTPSLSVGGAERVTVNFMNLVDGDKYNVICILIYPIENKELLVLNPNITVYQLDCKSVKSAFWKVKAILKKVNPDIVFSSLFRTNIILAILKRFFFFKYNLVTRSPNSPTLLIDNGEMNSIMRKAISFSYHYSNLVISQTKQMADEISQVHNIPPKKIRIVTNPVDYKKIDVLVNEECDFIETNGFNILSSGRLNYQKGFDILINSFSLLVKKNKNVYLHILGEGPERDNLTNMVRDYDLLEHVFFYGHQDNPYPFYKKADCFVLSSRWEGLPNVILENLYLNKYIVSTDCIDFLVDTFKETNTGVIVKSGDIDSLHKGMEKALLNYKVEIPTSRKEENILIVNEIFDEFN